MIPKPLSFEAGLYSEAPKFVSGSQAKYASHVTREFVYEGHQFEITVHPYITLSGPSEHTSYFPGRDEALIESVLMELSSRKAWGGWVVSRPVSDVIAILESYGLVIDKEDFLKSLEIMSGCKINIYGRVKDKTISIITSLLTFSVYNDLFINVKLNPMLDNSLLGGRFRATNKKEKNSKYRPPVPLV